MSASDSNRGFRQRLLELIDRSGVSDLRLSLLATGSTDTVRNLRRGSSPRLDSLEALCRVLGFRLEMAPLDEPAQPAFNRAMARWASGALPGLLAAARRQDDRLEPLVARNLVPAGRDTARHEERRLRDRAGHVRVAAGRAAPRSRSDRGRCRLARPEPGPRRVMACLVAQPEPRSGVGPRPLHARRRNRLRRAGSDGGRQARVACARQGGFSRRRVGASSPESSSSSTACSSRNPGFRAGVRHDF